MEQDEVIEQAITEVLVQEGGKVDNPADPGGATNRGITLTTYSQFLGRQATKDELWSLSDEATRQVYRWYIHGAGIDVIPYPLVLVRMVDFATLHGGKNAIRMLQRAVHVDDDGLIGQKTLAALAAFDPQIVYIRLMAERAELFGRLISKDLTDRDRDGIPDNTEFAAGWLKYRLAEPLRRIA